jgi:hypothetical protein
MNTSAFVRIIFNKITLVIFVEIFFILLLAFFMWIQGFEPLELFLVTVLISLIIIISGILYAIKQISSEGKNLAIMAIIICAIGLINWIFVTQNWFLMGGITDFMDLIKSWR